MSLCVVSCTSVGLDDVAMDDDLVGAVPPPAAAAAAAGKRKPRGKKAPLAIVPFTQDLVVAQVMDDIPLETRFAERVNSAIRTGVQTRQQRARRELKKKKNREPSVRVVTPSEERQEAAVHPVVELSIPVLVEHVADAASDAIAHELEDILAAVENADPASVVFTQGERSADVGPTPQREEGSMSPDVPLGQEGAYESTSGGGLTDRAMTPFVHQKKARAPRKKKPVEPKRRTRSEVAAEEAQAQRLRPYMDNSLNPGSGETDVETDVGYDSQEVRYRHPQPRPFHAPRPMVPFDVAVAGDDEVLEPVMHHAVSDLFGVDDDADLEFSVPPMDDEDGGWDIPVSPPHPYELVRVADRPRPVVLAPPTPPPPRRRGPAYMAALPLGPVLNLVRDSQPIVDLSMTRDIHVADRQTKIRAANAAAARAYYARPGGGRDRGGHLPTNTAESTARRQAGQARRMNVVARRDVQASPPPQMSSQYAMDYEHDPALRRRGAYRH